MNDNPDPTQVPGKTSGATRRIVVEDLPPDGPPKVQGRKLDTPADLNRSTRSTAPSSRPIDRDSQPAATAPRRSTANPVKVRKKSANTSINVKRLFLIAGGMIALPLLLVAMVFVLSALRRKNPTTAKPADAAQPAVKRELGTITTTEVSTPSPTPLQQAANSPDVDANEIRSMTVQLASQISQKSGYEFSHELVELIQARTHEYNSAKALLGAQQLRREINKSFRDEGLNPLVGYALAFSRSKFEAGSTDKGIGIWRIPLSVARSQGYVSAKDGGEKLRTPEVSAQISASYTKQLLSAFDADDFMYAIACFGMSLDEAGKLRVRLVNTAPESSDRRDIMKMVRAGVLTREQVDNLTRFFAAGIVGENPRRFGLSNSVAISDLY